MHVLNTLHWRLTDDIPKLDFNVAPLTSVQRSDNRGVSKGHPDSQEELNQESFLEDRANRL